MEIVLEVVEGPHRGQSFTFDGHDNFIVGRARFAHFRLPKKDPYFSRIHFMVEVNPPCCRLVDTGSTNGTRVNGRRVRAVDLRNGDLIQGGDTVLRVSFVPEAGVEVAQPPTPATATGHPELSEGTPDTTESFHPGPVAPSSGPTRAPVEPEQVPTIEGYQVLCRLGRGGMGEVYLATRLSDRTDVALKTIRPAASPSERQVQQFLREADILRRLRHPHIVAFHEMGRAGELFYFVMDYVLGTDASHLLAEHGPLAVRRAVPLICQVLEALDYAHGQGFVHRDVKPANVLVSGDPGYGICKLADFGLARVYHASPLSGLTILGDVGGTIPYMPPEQITDYRHASPAADQYSCAATLYCLLSGQFVFDFGTLPKQDRLKKILLDEPVRIQDRRAQVPERLAQAIHRALSRDPGARFPDAATFRAALLPFGADE